MIKIFAKVYFNMPFEIRQFVLPIIRNCEYYFFGKKIIKLCRKSKNDEIRRIGSFIEKKKKLYVFPYAFSDTYKENNIKVYKDEDNWLYIKRNGKRIYGKKKWGKKELQFYYNSLLMEQDTLSPHCYFPDDCDNRYPMESDIVADLGAAEGIFALDIIDKVKEVYLFENDPEWEEPLQRTFKPWKRKVHFVKKYIGDTSGGQFVTLDDFFRDKDLSYIKADIEGAEEAMLLGGEDTFRNKIKKLLICVYHKQESEKNIKRFLKRQYFKLKTNHGYMLYLSDIKLKEPYFRRGVVYAWK